MSRILWGTPRRRDKKRQLVAVFGYIWRCNIWWRLKKGHRIFGQEKWIPPPEKILAKPMDHSCSDDARNTDVSNTAIWPKTTVLYTVSGKKETNMFSVVSPTKLGHLLWNLAHSFLNKFAATWCKRFHLTWIMSLHYLVKLEMPLARVLQLHC